MAMSRARSILLAFTAFGGGYAAHFTASALVAPQRRPSSIAEHWKVINDYRAYMEDPRNYEVDPSGLVGVKDPCDIGPSLAALAAAGELEYVDLVFPLVPHRQEATRYWMTFVNEHREIVEASGNPEYVAYTTTGQQPLHLQLWFRKTAADDVQQLIKGLEAFTTVSKCAFGGITKSLRCLRCNSTDRSKRICGPRKREA